MPDQTPDQQSPLAPPPWLSNYATQIEGVQKADTEAFEHEQKELAPKYDRLSKTLGAGVPKPPEQEKVEAPPRPEDYHKHSMEFASAMAVLGAVSSAFTRHAGNASLNAFAGALNGWQQGNVQAYEEAAKRWEQATKQTIENNRQILEKYKLVLEDRKLNIDAQMAQIQLIASQYHDKITADAAAAKNYTLVAQIYEKNQTYTDKVAAAAQKLQENKNKQDEKNHTNAQWLASPTGQAWISTQPAGEQAKYNAFVQQYGKGIDPASVHEVATLIGTGKMAPLTGFALRSSWGQSVMADVQARFPNYSGTEYTAQNAGARAVGSRGGNISVSAVEADKAFGLARQASKNYPRGKFVPINRLTQMGAQAKSDPQYRQFMAANEAAVTAYSATMSRSGVNTVAAQKRAHTVLDTADSEQAYEAGLDQLQAEVNAVRTAPGEALGEVRSTLSNPNAAPAVGNEGWGELKVQ